jgi:regulator of protease activity HflC (stomatin/prohibitin superfamily)
MVGTMFNLVNEVLQAAVGNHFRNTLQALEAVTFINTRQQVQQSAFEEITRYLDDYKVETRGVYIQDVVLPDALVTVLTNREIANQERTTYEEQQKAQSARVEMEKAKGMAEMQAQLADSEVSVEINRNRAEAREAEAGGEAAYIRITGQAQADRVQAMGVAEAKATELFGLAQAEGFRAQRSAIGDLPTALVAIARAISDGNIDIMPDVLVTGGGSSLDALAATLVTSLRGSQNGQPVTVPLEPTNGSAAVPG